MKSNKLSKDVITHKLKIKWEWIKYISTKFAQNIFNQLQDPNKNIVQIVNPDKLLFITKYKSEVDLIKLDPENTSFEDTLFMSWLSESQKERVRSIWDLRKKERKARNQINLKYLIEEIQKWENI